MSVTKLPASWDQLLATPTGLRLGKLTGIDARGRVLVQIGEAAPTPAWLGLSCSRSEVINAIEGERLALVAFTPDGPDLPILVALVREGLPALDDAVPEDAPPVRSVTASESLELVCGKARLELRADGTITATGTDVRSTSTGTNRIEGAVVKIN